MNSIDDVHFPCTCTPDHSSQETQLLRQLDYEINRVRENLLLGRTYPGARPEWDIFPHWPEPSPAFWFEPIGFLTQNMLFVVPHSPRHYDHWRAAGNKNVRHLWAGRYHG